MKVTQRLGGGHLPLVYTPVRSLTMERVSGGQQSTTDPGQYYQLGKWYTPVRSLTMERVSGGQQSTTDPGQYYQLGKWTGDSLMTNSMQLHHSAPLLSRYLIDVIVAYEEDGQVISPRLPTMKMAYSFRKTEQPRVL